MNAFLQKLPRRWAGPLDPGASTASFADPDATALARCAPVQAPVRAWCRGLVHVLALAFALGFPGIPGARGGDAPPSGTPVEIKDASLVGRLEGDKARLLLEATLGNPRGPVPPGLYGAAIEHRVDVGRDRLGHAFAVRVESLQGGLREVVLGLGGEGEITGVEGEGLRDWSVRKGASGSRQLVLRLDDADPPRTNFVGRIRGETRLGPLPAEVTALSLSVEPAALGHGYVRVSGPAEWSVQVRNPSGMVPVPETFLPEGLRGAGGEDGPGRLAYRFHGSAYVLPMVVGLADPEARQVTLSGFRLAGRVEDDGASFELTATARVRNPAGGELEVLSGGVALGEVPGGLGEGVRLRFDGTRYLATFDRAGEFPLRLRFQAAVRPTNGWSAVDFRVAAAALAPVRVEGLGEEAQVRFEEGARPVRGDGAVTSHLPPSGRLRLAWREAAPEEEGRLFYSAEAVTQVSVAPGLMRQVSLFDVKVMQGELSRLVLLLRGEGEVTRVQGAAVLAWELEPAAEGADRRLVIRFNQPQRDQTSFQLQVQRALAAFPQAIEAVRLEPEGATRFAGSLRVVNQGAVRLEILESAGLSQISPEQFVQTDAVRALLPEAASQVFAFRFAGAATRLRVQADNILPELAVSAVLAYHLGETELAVDAEFEVDVREAPLRELLLRVPAGYGLARLNASGLGDHFLTPLPDGTQAQLRLVYGAPVSGRQVIQLRLERNSALGAARWALPRLDVPQARTVRGHVGVTTDAGYRVTPVQTSGLTELAPAFFPKKIPGMQAAFRISEPSWAATLEVERLAQSIQADAFHLFSVGEGIAYGSSLVNYVVSGAPVATLQVELSGEYFNVEFTGKNVRNWQKTDRGYAVQLHTPVAGPYTLLATYERPFKAQGEALGFTGARPVDAQIEQGYTLVVSAYPFQVQPVAVGGSLSPIEPGEVPAEYRLFFDAPILAAYRYTARPFNLQLDLRPFTQQEGVGQVVDRASLTTRVSEEGQVVTEARYFVKNKGAPNLGLVLPEGAELWSVTVDGTSVVPVKDGAGNPGLNLIPLPHRPDPEVVLEVQAKFAFKARTASRLTVTAPRLSVPVLLAEWRVMPADGRRLVYLGGTLTPAEGVVDTSGFAGLGRLLASGRGARLVGDLTVAVAGLLLGAWIWSLAASRAGRRFGVRHLLAGLLGLGAALLALGSLWELRDWALQVAAVPAPDLRFVAPVQGAEVAWRLNLENVPVDRLGFPWSAVLIALLAPVAWVAGWLSDRPAFRVLLSALGWTFLGWAALRLPNGAPVFFLVLLGFGLFRVLLPSAWRWWRAEGPGASGAPVPAAVVLALVLGGSLIPGVEARAQAPGPAATAVAAKESPAARKPAPVATLPVGPRGPVVADSVEHEIRVEDDAVLGTARIRWNPAVGDVLPLFVEPGVLTRSGHPTNGLRLVTLRQGDRAATLLVAGVAGPVDFTLDYQARVGPRPGAEAGGAAPSRGFLVPVPPGLVHRARVTVRGQDVEVVSPQAVRVHRETAGEGTTNTVAELVLAPSKETWMGWIPRSRDTRRERAVFYAESAQVFVPGPGVIEGWHEIQIRPAQGELDALVFEVPAGATVTDVVSPSLSFWRFDPDARRLRVTLSPAQSKPFAVQVRSQFAAAPLPFERPVGLVGVEGAAGQIGLAGVATGVEVQLDDVTADGFAPINLEDFPAGLVQPLSATVPGLTVRRAFRAPARGGVLGIKASAVEPDVRVETQQTLSLGEDRTVLAAALQVEVIRAGIFKLSFPLPAGFEIDTLGGAAMSHWTELKNGDERIVTLHLKGKTEGRQTFNLALAGAGVRSTRGWNVPRLSIREATKQRGQLLVVPEQGLRLQVAQRDGATQLDPVQAGVRQKGVLAFRLLQDPWTLSLDLDRVDAWVQVTGLQHVTLAEAQAKVAVNLQYEVENTGVKSLVVRLPAQADNVRFRGEQVTDFLARPGGTNTAFRDWEVKLERRVLGKYLLQAEYTLPLPAQANTAALDGVVAQEVNLQRGFVTLQAGGRLQVRVEPPPALQASEWQVIPRGLLKDIAAPSAEHVFRLVEPAFQLPIRLERREAARLLPARVNRVTLTSVVSDDGAVLTQVRMEMSPGDSRLLRLTLPRESRFWFAFVNQNSVWPWQSTNQILLPLEANSQAGASATVEFFYSGVAGPAGRRSLDLAIPAPKFDLPLENIEWHVFLNEKWKVRDWSGSLQLRDPEGTVVPASVDLDGYIRQEAELRQGKMREAEQFLSLANGLLLKGDPQQARRAFQAAYGMSQHDQAFNEDARVQLNNLKLQQAMVGLNVRQARVAGDANAPAATPRALWDNQTVNYSQGEAKQLLERNTVEDSAVQQRLAERLIQQQEAAVAAPAAIRATVPEQGRRLTFTRPLEVNTWTELRVGLRAEAAGRVRNRARLGWLALVFLGFAVLRAMVARRGAARES